MSSRSDLRSNRQERASIYVAIIAGVAALVAAVISSVVGPQTGARIAPSDLAYQAGQIDGLKLEVTRLRKEQRELVSAVAKAPQDTRIQVLFQRIDLIERKQARLEQVFMDSPEKALELPLLKKDLENAKTAQAENLLSIKASVDQVYDLNKWLLGAMAIAVLGLAFARLVNLKAE